MTHEAGLEARSLSFEELAVGMRESMDREITDATIRAFAAVSGDHNPLHLSDKYAAETPFRGRIAHGMLSAGLISAVLGMRLPGSGGVYLSQTLMFRAPVRIGDVVRVTVEIVELVPAKRHVRLHCVCTVAGRVVVDGDAWVFVPHRQRAAGSAA